MFNPLQFYNFLKSTENANTYIEMGYYNTVASIIGIIYKSKVEYQNSN
jgi:hypothetical protein